MNWSDKEDLQQVIQGCLEGGRKSQQLVYERFYGKMMGVSLRYSKNSEEAKDILQDGFIKVFTNLERYGGNGSFEGWIRRIVVNTAIDFYRMNKNIWLSTDSAHIENIKEESEDDTESKYSNISLTEILKHVQELSPAYRTVFNLYILEGYTHQEIADTLGISEGTSKSNLAKAKRNLRKIFEKQLTHEH